MPYLEDLSLIYESVVLTENADKRIAYLHAKYFAPLVKTIMSPMPGYDNAIDWVLSSGCVSIEELITGPTNTEKDYDDEDEDYDDDDTPPKPSESECQQLSAQWAKDIIEYVVNNLDSTHGKYSEWFLRTMMSDVSGRVAGDWGDAWSCIISIVSGTEEDFEDHEMEDFYKWKDYITAYDRFKGSLPVQQRDINAFHTLKEFVDVAIPLTFRNKRILVAKLRAELDPNEYVQLVSHVDGWDVFVPKTEAASKALGGATNWCTADLRDEYNAFSSYAQDGPLFIFTQNNEAKYQLHMSQRSRRPSGAFDIQFMDELDKKSMTSEVPKSVWKALSQVRHDYTAPYLGYFEEWSQ